MLFDGFDGWLGWPHPGRGNRAFDVCCRIRRRHQGQRKKLIAHIETEHASVATVDARNGFARDPCFGDLLEERIDTK